MKNMLATLGSKKAIGAALVAVTLVVGLGVVNNFSDTDKRRANDEALSNFGDNSYNNFYGNTASRSDLERQLSLGQDSNTARFFRGTSDGADEDDAFSADGAYGEGVRSDEGFVYGDVNYGKGGAYGNGAQGGAYDPSNPMFASTGGGAYENEPIYVQGNELDGKVAPYGTSYGAEAGGAVGAGSIKNTPDSSRTQGAMGTLNPDSVAKGKVTKFGKVPGAKGNGEAGADGGTTVAGAPGAKSAGEKGAKGTPEAAAEAALSRADKAKQARDRANRMRRATQINKLADSNGGGSSWGSLSGANFGGLGSMSNYGDSGSRPLQSTNAGQTNNGKVDPFRFGRGGNMGGYNVGRGNGAETTGDRGKGLDALNSALFAQRASMRGSRSKVTEGAKKAAEEAFDGSGGDDGGAMITSGASIQQAASQLASSSVNPSAPPSLNLGPSVANLAEKREKLEELQEQWDAKFWDMMLWSSIMSVATAVLAVIAWKNLPTWWGIAMLVIAALLMIANLLYIWEMATGFLTGNSEESLLGLARQMTADDLAPVNEDLKWYYKPWLAITSGIGLSLIGITAFLAGESVFGQLGSIISLCVVGLEALTGGIGKIVNTLTGKSEEELEEESNEADGGGNSGGGSGGGN